MFGRGLIKGVRCVGFLVVDHLRLLLILKIFFLKNIGFFFKVMVNYVDWNR